MEMKFLSNPAFNVLLFYNIHFYKAMKEQCSIFNKK